jgi:hypothetical protein
MRQGRKYCKEIQGDEKMLKRRIWAMLLAALLTLTGLSALAAEGTTLLRHGVDTITGYEYIAELTS